MSRQAFRIAKMKKVAFVWAACALSSSSAWAALAPLYEPFNYNAGTTLGGVASSPDSGAHAWARTGTTVTADDEATAGTGNLTLPGTMPAPQGGQATYGGTGYTDRINVVDTPGTGIATGRVYFSMALTINDTGTVTGQTGAVGQIIAAFNNTVGAQATNPNAHGADLWIQPGSAASTFHVGFSRTPSTTTRTFDTTDIPFGQSVFVVAAYEFVAGSTNDNAYLWINPTTLGAAENALPAPTISVIGGAVADLADIKSFLLYQTATTTTNTLGANGVQVDELRVDSTYAGVTPVPEPAAALCVAGIGMLGLLRPRRHA